MRLVGAGVRTIFCVECCQKRPFDGATQRERHWVCRECSAKPRLCHSFYACDDCCESKTCQQKHGHKGSCDSLCPRCTQLAAEGKESCGWCRGTGWQGHYPGCMVCYGTGSITIESKSRRK